MLVLGIDIGAISIAWAVVNPENSVIAYDYQFHYGQLLGTLKRSMSGIDFSTISAVAITDSTPLIFRNTPRYNTQIAVSEALRFHYPQMKNILMVGGENFGLITFDEKGKYKSYKGNSACAAGTGAFLDQQAIRLGFEGASQLTELAEANKDSIPPIATRCAVFAKTDLIHAQQEGYSLSQICDGLCRGVAQNIVDTVIGDNKITGSLFFTGGVSKNRAVVRHIEELLQTEVLSDEFSPLYGAIGVAMLQHKNGLVSSLQISGIETVIEQKELKKNYGYPALSLKLSKYPDFHHVNRFNYRSNMNEMCMDVEVDIYEDLEDYAQNNVFLGVDIGSTSTKAVIIDEHKTVLLGLYTRTAGKPIQAVQQIFEAIWNISKKEEIHFNFMGVGTTGSGRKFIGKVIGADLIVDEITAHARAAFELNPEVDTIIEIGGQDAKFTTLNNGMVTFSVMNTVCAAGTGSFIEEQANKLGVSLTDYSARAENKQAPMASDRCTVFMERDLNFYLNNGYSVDEVLASVLHSVRENYLTKVATEGLIGDNICFQGATAKNQALVAAFEQRLGKPLSVSKFCHVTGALGSALLTLEEKPESTAFKGISLFSENIHVAFEVCNLCRNNCKIRKIERGGEVLAFGFLCGRDYETQHFVRHKASEFSLLEERKKCFAVPPPVAPRFEKTLGIPAALFLSDNNTFWKYFFNSLCIKTIISTGNIDSVSIGKRIANSEFCSPLLSYYGHVHHLSSRADYLFLPVYFDSENMSSNDEVKQYCYFSQFASSLASISSEYVLKDRILMPEIGTKSFVNKIELYRALKSKYEISYWHISRAYDAAKEFVAECEQRLQKIYQREEEDRDDIGIVFLGRPYTILDSTMNKGIPDIFASLEVKTFFQDMFSDEDYDIDEVQHFIKEIPWTYAAKVIEAATIVAKKRGLYPVYITSFKCGPDSFTAQYFKKIMEKYKKPYLILQLDDHGSNVGHTTRIEAAIRSFRNHYLTDVESQITTLSFPDKTESLTRIKKKILLLPSWDDLVGTMHEAILIKEGIDARMVPLTQRAVQEGPRSNTGQCLPVNLMFQSFVHYIEENDLDPAKTSVWMFHSQIACNISMYPSMLQSLFENYGRGLEKVTVYIGQLSYSDISITASLNVYFSYLFGGMLKKMGCKIRPYEVVKGTTDEVIEKSLRLFYRGFLSDRDKVDVVKEVTNLFLKIQTKKTKRPKIAIIGDLYARDNEVMNQDLIKTIEKDGGEVIVTPYNEYLRIIEDALVRRWFRKGFYRDIFTAKTVGKYCLVLENSVYQYFNQVLEEEKPTYKMDVKKILDQFNIKDSHSGESFDNVLKIFHLIGRYPDISLFVLANPAFCSAGMVTEAMIEEIEKVTSIPIVSLMYDGTGKFQNSKLAPYLYSLNEVQ